MCSEYVLKTQAKDLQEIFGASLPSGMANLNIKVLPHKPGWVMTANGLREMNFSLIPSWSKERRPKFATHNARMETLLQKPTWKGPIQKQRCLVPLSGFVEPIYEHEFAGNMVNFFPIREKIIAAAGIFDEWVDASAVKVIHSFAIITSEPMAFVKKHGHDRSPVFLKKEAFKNWLDPEFNIPEKVLKILKEQSYEPLVEAQKERPMRPGWENRKKDQAKE